MDRLNQLTDAGQCTVVKTEPKWGTEHITPKPKTPTVTLWVTVPPDGFA